MSGQAAARRLLVADSFRVRERDGVAKARGFSLHLARFTRAVQEVRGPLRGDPARDDLSAALDDAVKRIGAAGAGFPRLELWSDEPLPSAALRPCPEIGSTIELRTAGALAVPDADCKGPSIARHAEINRRLGAEALLVDRRGAVVEGATTALVWWSRDSLVTVASPARVPSVTERLVRDIAIRSGVRVIAAQAPPSVLRSAEVWALNALHGIRAVTAIDDRPQPVRHAHRLEHFRAALDLTWQPLSD